jgi:hypothetical protein
MTHGPELRERAKPLVEIGFLGEAARKSDFSHGKRQPAY